jgi:hypothetical protein
LSCNAVPCMGIWFVEADDIKPSYHERVGLGTDDQSGPSPATVKGKVFVLIR